MIDSLNSYFSHIQDLIAIIEKHEGKKLEKCEEESLEEEVKQKLASVEAAAAIFDKALIAEVMATLLELTAVMERVIDAALTCKSPEEIIVERSGITIKRIDMCTLNSHRFVNDQIINFYMQLIKERGKTQNYPTVYAFSSFFYLRLSGGGHAALKKWTRKDALGTSFHHMDLTSADSGRQP